ncbi:AAA family ATPase [Desulfopila sp. IMCC35008]|uniref:AAA family ATPase n=1 Tax=Desulfopila sp. IMCC35008 TaxID=2653858 RepID=UPI0013D10E02|nr:AAA family ATPase [Desulfopila sp. IMCC35008]
MIDSASLTKKHLSPHQLNIPHKLFGRNSSKQLLLSAFDRSSCGSGEILLVPGQSGIGKTSLVQSLQLPIEAKNGWFVQGKFDQYQQNTPYYAVRQALLQLWQKMHPDTDGEVKLLHGRIRQEVGDLGSLLVTLIPEIGQAFDKQTQIEEIGLFEARHRFASVIKKFLQAVCLPDHPTVMFIDDWQWADSASLELLKQLHLETPLRYFLLIASYRDDVIGKNHPLASVFTGLQSHHTPPEMIEIRELTKTDIKDLIFDALKGPINGFDELTDFILNHTKGNPFYIRTMLEYFHENSILCYDPSGNIWNWTDDSDSLPESVVGMFVERLKHFNQTTQKLLSLAACLGNRFSLLDLSMISGESIESCRSTLSLVADLNLLLPEDAVGSEKASHPDSYRFIHDRVQQAAFLLIEKEKLCETHLIIGRQLLSSLSEAKLDEHIYKVLEHLNSASSLINTKDEINRMIQLNMAAARKARLATAFGAMLKFNRAALSFAEKIEGGINEFWKNHYERALNLFRNLAESEFIEGDKEQAESIIQKSLKFTKTSVEKAETLNILIVHYTLLAKYVEAIEAGRQALLELDIVLPENDFEQFRDEEISLFQKLLGDRTVMSLAQSPVMEDLEKRTAAKLLITLGPPCYRTHQRLWSVIVPKVVNLTITHGLIPQIGYSHTAFGGLLGWVHNDYKTARELGELAEQVMVSTVESPSDQSVFYLMIGSSIRHWFKHLRDASQDYLKAYQIGSQGGNLQYAAYAFGHNMYCRFYQAIPISELIYETQQSLVFSKSRRNQWAIDMLEGGLLIFNQLSAETKNNSDNRLEEEYLDQVENHHNIQVLCIYRIVKTFSLLLLCEHKKALALSDEAELLMYTVGTQGLLPWPEHVFTRFLILSGLYRNADRESQCKWRSELNRIFEQLQLWSDSCPENYNHKLLLASAELKRLDGHVTDALVFYDQAINSAKAGDFLQWEGIANERMSLCCQEFGNDTLAQIYWQQAYSIFHRWGASLKVHLMEMEFSNRILSWQQHALPEKIDTIEADLNIKIFLEKQVENLRSRALEKAEVLQSREISKEAADLAKATERLRLEVVQRKRVEDALRMSENRLKNLIQNLHAGVVVHAPDTSILLANEQASMLLGLSIEQMMDKTAINPVLRFLYEDGSEMPIEKYPVRVVIATLKPLLGKVLSINRPGTDDLIWVLVNAFPELDNTGQLLQVIVTFVDVTELRQALEALRKSEALLNETGRSGKIGGWEINLNNQVLAWTEETFRIHELPPSRQPDIAEAINYYHSDDRSMISSAVQYTIDTGTPFELEARLITAKSNQLWVRATGQIITQDGLNIGICGSLQDITERKQAEDENQKLNIQLRHAQKMEAIGTLAGGIAHEFNNMLTIIMGNNELIMEELPQYSLAKESAEEIQIAGLRARDVVKQLLTFSKQDDSVKKVMDVKLVVQESMKLIRSTTPANIKIEQNLSADTYLVKGNDSQISQLLINLCYNAVDAMLEKVGKLTVKLSNETIEKQQTKYHSKLNPGQYTKLMVNDNGIGMNTETLERVFEPFFTTKDVGKGSGLGLAIVHGIVERHDGVIIVDSHPGQGTAFTILLPTYEGPFKQEIDNQNDLPTGDEYILYVDDEKAIAHLGKRRLESLGYRTESTTDPLKALEMVKADPHRFDLVITDMAMPNLTGDQLIVEILKVRQDMPTIICTGYSAKMSDKKAKEMGVSSFAMKPLAKSDLAIKVRKVLDEAKN